MTLGRPPTPIGSYGSINARQIKPGVWEARTYFKEADGSLSRPKRRGATETQATNNLKAALTEMAQRVLAGQVNAATKFRVVAELYYADLELAVELGNLSPNTLRVRRSYLDNHILPALGGLRCKPELTVTAINNLRRAKLGKGMKPAHWRQIQVVIAGVCDVAVVAKALDSNPVKDLPKLTKSTGAKTAAKKVRALSKTQRADVAAALEADAIAVRHSVPAIVHGLLAAGVRIAELIACSGEDLERVDGRPFLRVDHRLITVKGKGTVRIEREENSKGKGQYLELPKWTWAVLGPRKLAAGPTGPLFPAIRGGWMNPSSAVTNVSAAMDRAGFDWVTSHVMRKTHGTVLAEAGLAARQVMQRLGHTQESTTEKYYIAEVAQDPAVMEALEGMVDETGEDEADSG